jgi:iron complex outermembrane receptor protein
MISKTTNGKKLVAFRQWSRKPYAVFSSLKLQLKICVLSVAYSLVNPVQECKAQTDSTAIEKKMELEEVEVTGQRAPVLASQVSRMVTVITRREMEQAPAQSINELLENVPQVDIRQRGTNGVQADISIQGGSFDQTLILLNGINLTDPQTGHHNLNLPIGLSSVDRMEILKGPASRVFGPNAFAGAVNFVTGENTRNTIHAAFTGGDFGYYNGNVCINQHSGKIHNLLEVTKSGSNGYSSNTDYTMWNAFYHGKIAFKRNFAGIQLGYMQKDFGANSFYSPKLPNQYESNNTYFGSINGSFGTQWKIIPAIYWRRNYDHFIFDRTIPANGANFHYTDVYGANINITYAWLYGRSSFGADYRNEIIYSTSLGKLLNSGEQKEIPGENGKCYTHSDWRENKSLYAEHTIHSDRMNISVGFMVNNNTKRNKTGMYPGVDVSLNLTPEYKAFFTVNRSLRLPTFTDLYYKSKAQLGDIDLKPEEAWIVEIGLKAGKGNLSWNVSCFHKWGKQTIDYIWRDTIWHAENITELNTDGVEASLSFKSGGFIEQAQLSYSLILVNKSSGSFPSYYALDYLKHKVCASVSHKIYKNISVYWQASVQERNGYYDKWDATGKTSIQTTYHPYLLIDGRIAWQHRVCKAFIESTNLLNEDYIDIGNILQPGTWVKVGLEINIPYK